ncbi:MAG: hypothetical protein C0P79_012385 [Gammaproteobacteria bacterium]
MASPVDVCNLALAHLGDAANVQDISPPDGSRQAELCAMFYPVARDGLLEYGWSFNTRRQRLALLDIVPPIAWQYAYALPASCLRPLELRALHFTSDVPAADYIVEALPDSSRVIYTNVEQAELKYAVRVTDLNRWTPGAVIALSWLLASMLAGPLVKGKTGVQLARDAQATFARVLAEARANDANSSKQDDIYKSYKPSWITDR